MKMLAVRVGLWFRAAEKGPAATETQGLLRGAGERVGRPIDTTDEKTVVPQRTQKTAVEGSWSKENCGVHVVMLD